MKIRSKHAVIFSLAAVCCAAVIIIADGSLSQAFAGTTDVTTDAAEFDSTWTKVSAGIKGNWGKLVSLGIVATSIWNREKIGMLGMGAGCAVGFMVPQIPAILNTVSATI